MRSRIARGFGAIAVGLCLALATASACHAQQCIGDCNGDGTVKVNELIAYLDDVLDGGNRCVNKPPPDVCDPGHLGVYISCLPIAVHNALTNCPVAARAE